MGLGFPILRQTQCLRENDGKCTALYWLFEIINVYIYILYKYIHPKKKNIHLGPQKFQFSLKKWRDHDQNITVKNINYTFLTFSVGCCVPEVSYDWTEKSDTERNPSGFVLPNHVQICSFLFPGTLPVLYLHPWENRSVNILALGFTCT